MSCFSTFYDVDDVEFMSFVLAKTPEEASALIRKRNIGERLGGEVIGPHRKLIAHDIPSNHYHLRRLLDCAHGLAFIGWIATRSRRGLSELTSDGLIELTDLVLSDRGVLHDVIHEIQFPQLFNYRAKVMTKIRRLEVMVPGLLT